MLLAGFEPTIPVFKRAKTFHPLDRAATVTGILCRKYSRVISNDSLKRFRYKYVSLNVKMASSALKKSGVAHDFNVHGPSVLAERDLC
jgi:hypothetical protein